MSSAQTGRGCAGGWRHSVHERRPNTLLAPLQETTAFLFPACSSNIVTSTSCLEPSFTQRLRFNKRTILCTSLSPCLMKSYLNSSKHFSLSTYFASMYFLLSFVYVLVFGPAFSDPKVVYREKQTPSAPPTLPTSIPQSLNSELMFLGPCTPPCLGSVMHLAICLAAGRTSRGSPYRGHRNGVILAGTASLWPITPLSLPSFITFPLKLRAIVFIT